jgi:hypothetical protein
MRSAADQVRPPVRERAASEIAQLPDALQGLAAGARYPVRIAERFRQLTVQVDRRIDKQAGDIT